MMRKTPTLFFTSALAALVLAACGGGGGGSTPMPPGGTAGSMAVSSGTVTAFGSIFVNGHEFSTRDALVIDDDTGSASADTSELEVGMNVDVRLAADSTAAMPSAAEVHLHPLVRGVVDGSNSALGTITVMGQTVQLTASTNFSDHRACVGAATSPCTAISGQSGLLVTAGSGASAVAGSYVTVHGYLFSPGSAGGSANVVATLVSVSDVPATGRPVAYKAEGVVTAASAGSISIGGLAVNLGSAKCYNASGLVACTSAFSTGQVVSAFGASAPALPATSFTADAARLRSKLVVQTAGAAVELEGKVSSVTPSPASFVLRGVTVDASALASGTLPAVGDVVEVAGVVAADGTSVTASSVKLLHAALAASYGFEGDAGAVAAGTASNTYVLSLLGQSITVNAGTRLADMTRARSSTHPFNISTFQAYLAASASQHLLVRTQADGTGQLTATSVTIVPPSTAAAVGGKVDAAPAPVNGTAGITPTTFSVHGLAVSADVSSVIGVSGPGDDHGFGATLMGSTATVAAGDLVLVRGTYAAGKITVAATSGVKTPRLNNIVIDYGAGRGGDRDCF